MSQQADAAWPELSYRERTHKLDRRSPELRKLRKTAVPDIQGATTVLEFLKSMRSREQFLRETRHPFLLINTTLKPAPPSEVFRTRRVLASDRLRRKDLLQRSLLPIRKAEGSIFTQMITVGRTANNDLIFPVSQVSKLHAYFSRREDEWFLTDCASSNGTLLGGELMPSETPTPISSNQEIIFGAVLAADFYQPAELLRYLDIVAKLRARRTS